MHAARLAAAEKKQCWMEIIWMNFQLVSILANKTEVNLHIQKRRVMHGTTGAELLNGQLLE